MHIIKWFKQVLSNYPVFKMSWKLQGCKFIFFFGLLYQFSEQLTWRVISPEKRGRETWDKMSGQNDKFIICQILGAVCLYPVSGRSLTTREEGFFSILTVFQYSQRLKYTTTNYCGIIIVRGGSMFVDLVG